MRAARGQSLPTHTPRCTACARPLLLQSYQLAANNGPNGLHGGVVGWDKVNWSPRVYASEGAVGVGACACVETGRLLRAWWAYHFWLSRARLARLAFGAGSWGL